MSKDLRNEVVTAATAVAPEDDICGVCLNTFNKSTRAKSACPYCHTGICRGCLQTYLLSDISDIPPCVNTDCKHAWEREFLDEQFTRTFRLSIYKEHREKVLADREKARLPATQEDAAAYKAAHDIYIERDKEVKALELQMRALQQALWQKERERHMARMTVDTYGRRRPGVAGATGGGSAVAGAEEKAKPAAFIKPCPAPDCRGFLSTAWKCGLCNLWSCPDCHELKGETRDTEHTCDATKVATVRMLEKEAKACPKCGALICKISGCDQMWCTNCNTAFNWKTGTIAHGPIHNPHYFHWLQAQQRAGGAAAAGVGGGGFPGPCAANWETDRAIARTLDIGTGHRYGRASKQVDGSDLKDKLYLAEAWRLMREAQDLRDHDPDMEEKFRQLRVQYMCGEINEDEWKTRLQRLEKDVNFNRSIRQVRETFTGVAHDLIRQVLTTNGAANPSIAAERVTEIRAQVEKLIAYCNECYENITKRFGRKTPLISFRAT